MGPLKKRPTFWDMVSDGPPVVAQPLPAGYLQTYSRDYSDLMRLTAAHEQDEVARAAEQLAALQSKMNFGVPGFQPPRPAPPRGPSPPAPPAPPAPPMRSTQ